MRIRLTGTHEECNTAVRGLREVFDVVDVSAPYPNRGSSSLMRVYVELRLDIKATRTIDGGTEAGV